MTIHMNKTLNSPYHHFSLSRLSFFQPTMSRQIGSFHRSNSHPANLQNPIPIIPLFAFPPPDSPQTNTSSCMNSDTNSDITTFLTISQLNNSDIETPDEFADSEPSPSTYTQTNSSTFSKPPFDLFNLKTTVHLPPLLLMFPK